MTVKSACFAKDHFRSSPSTSTRRRRPCHDGHVTAHGAPKFRWKKSHPVAYSSGRTAPILGILGALLTALLNGLQRGQPVACLVKMVHSGHGWLSIVTADVLPTTGSVSSMLVALLHDDWSACSTRAHSGDETCC